MSIEDYTQKVREAVEKGSGLNATVKFHFGDDGCIFIDATQTPGTVSNEDSDAQCTIKMTLDTFGGLLSGSLNPMAAFMQGKFKIEGDMGVAMRMQSVFGGR
ncbi:MAG: SCP2 sterol-binding domain-containing protein [Nannocystaceae bacterium]|nr:SCP2 sterol-binding domain-containing protein [Myxococcales bacterium]